MTNPYLAPTLPVELTDNRRTWAEAWLQEATDRAVQRNPKGRLASLRTHEPRQR